MCLPNKENTSCITAKRQRQNKKLEKTVSDFNLFAEKIFKEQTLHTDFHLENIVQDSIAIIRKILICWSFWQHTA